VAPAPALVEAFAGADRRLERRNHDGGLPGGAQERAEAPVRSRRGRRRDALAAVPADHAAANHAATFYNLIVGIIATLQIFEQSYILTRDGGPAQSTYFIAYYLRRATFRFNEIGYGAAMSWALLLILAITLVQFRWANRWVYYEGKR
jgi:hypothetical protein